MQQSKRTRGQQGAEGPNPRSLTADEFARELHDTVVQSLTTLLVLLEAPGPLPDERRVEVVDLARDALTAVRRMLYELREESGQTVDLAGDVRRLAVGFASRTGIQARVAVDKAWPRDLRRDVAHQLGRVIAESLENVAIHAAASAVTIILDVADGDLRVRIADNGRGVPSFEPAAYTGLGTRGMRERAFILGGRLTIARGDASGTTVTLLLPRRAAS